MEHEENYLFSSLAKFEKFICFQKNVTSKCDIPPTAPKKIEEVINQCQDEIKIAILAGK